VIEIHVWACAPRRSNNSKYYEVLGMASPILQAKKAYQMAAIKSHPEKLGVET
jgi:DnaJ-class molecular chaperone